MSYRVLRTMLVWAAATWLITATSYAATRQIEWLRPPFSRALTSMLQKTYNRDYVELKDKNIDWNKPPFRVGVVDLPAKRANLKSALIVQWEDSVYCGSGGCGIDVWFMGASGDYAQAASLQGTEIEVGRESSKGYPDLWLDGALFRWNGRAYERP